MIDLWLQGFDESVATRETGAHGQRRLRRGTRDVALSSRRTSTQLRHDLRRRRRRDVVRRLHDRRRHVLRRQPVAGRWRLLATYHRTYVVVVVVIIGERRDVLPVVPRSSDVALR